MRAAWEKIHIAAKMARAVHYICNALDAAEIFFLWRSHSLFFLGWIPTICYSFPNYKRISKQRVWCQTLFVHLYLLIFQGSCIDLKSNFFLVRLWQWLSFRILISFPLNPQGFRHCCSVGDGCTVEGVIVK